MNAPASAGQRRGTVLAGPGEGGYHRDSACGMGDVIIADGNVGHLTHRTGIRAGPYSYVLVLGGEQNSIAGLAEASPVILHEIRFNQYANRILEFDVILDDEGMAVWSADEVRVALHPLPRGPEVGANNLEVGRRRSRRSAAEHDRLARGFQEVILNLERTVLGVAGASENRMSVDTRPGDRDAMEIAEIGIDNGYRS